jgi:hypothetical protein
MINLPHPITLLLLLLITKIMMLHRISHKIILSRKGRVPLPHHKCPAMRRSAYSMHYNRKKELLISVADLPIATSIL